MKKYITLFTAFLCLFLPFSGAWAQNIKSTDNTAVELFYNGNDNIIARFTIAPDWHIYWSNPGEIGLPTIFTSDNAKVKVLNQSVPKPHLAYDIMREYIYENTAYYDLQISEFLPQSNLMIEFVECNDECKNEKISFNLNELTKTPKPIWRQIKQSAENTFPQPLTLQLNHPYNEVKLPIAESGEFFFIPTEKDLLEEKDININKQDSQLLIRWHTENPKILRKALLITPTTAYIADINYNNNILSTFFYVVLLAFLGGIILNAMPCVFPILSLKIFSLLKNRRKRNRWLSALSYTAGVLTSFLILTFCLIHLKQQGDSAGWGFQLQSPWFVGAMAVLFFIMFLFMTEWLRFPNIARKKMHKIASLNNFTTGFFAVLIASPCTGPFMGAAIGYALMMQPLQIILVFAALALGYALPYALIELFPQTLQRVLPKPGAWMNKLKTILSIPVLLTSIWLFSVLYSQTIHTTSANNSSASLNWQPYNAQQIAELNLQKENIFIDFTADWCLTCKFNEALIINSTRFKDFATKQNVHLFKADLTENNDEYNAALNYYGRDGIPLYVYYRNGNYKILPLFFSIADLKD